MIKREIKRDFLDPKVLARLARLELQARTLVEGSFSGKHKSPHKGSSVEFSQYRKYAPGDDINNIDWRIYARTDRFYIKEFEADTNLRCYLVLDCSASMSFQGSGMKKIEYGKRIAATLAHLLIKQSDAVGLHCFNNQIIKDIPPRTNAKHLHAIYEELSVLKPEGESDIVKILHDLAEKIRRRALVIVISDFFHEPAPLLDCFQHLIFRKHDLALFHLIDDDELEFNFQKPTRFLDLENGFSMVTDPAIIKGDYLHYLRKYLNELKHGCQQFKIDYNLAKTTTPYEEILSTFLLNRQRRRRK